MLMLLLLTGGAIINVAVAWGCALFVIGHSGPTLAITDIASHSGSHDSGWEGLDGLGIQITEVVWFVGSVRLTPIASQTSIAAG